MKLPFIIAEISANHNGSLSQAKKLIKLAKKQGADAVKIQTYTADTMTLNSNKKIYKIKSGLWKGKTLWDLYEKAKTPLKWHKELFEYAKKNKITIFSTPFDTSAVDFLESINCPIYKVSSFEMNDLNLIKKIANTKKPMIISTGLASLKEISSTVKHAKKNGAKKIILLYCVSNYPSNLSDFNLNNIKILKDKFKCEIGLSDHSKDNKVAIGAVVAGAKIFEKHIGLKNQKKGLDIDFSIKGKEIGEYVNDIKNMYQLVNKKNFFRSKSELKNRFFRRSIFSIQNIRKGEKFTIKNIKTLRPSIGLSASYYENVLGKKSLINIKAGKPLLSNWVKMK